MTKTNLIENLKGAKDIHELVYAWNQFCEWGEGYYPEGYLNTFEDLESVVNYDIDFGCEEDDDERERLIQRFKEDSDVKDGDLYYYYMFMSGIQSLNENEIRNNHIEYDELADYLITLILKHHCKDLESHQYYNVDWAIKDLKECCPTIYNMVMEG